MKQNNIFFRYFSLVAAQQKLYVAALVALLSSSAYEAEAQVGEPFIHDPSTIALCDGKYYTFGTGEGWVLTCRMPLFCVQSQMFPLPSVAMSLLKLRGLLPMEVYPFHSALGISSSR